MVKRSVNTITDIEYCLSFAPFILWDFFLDKSCEGFFSFRGVIPCSAVHQPYSSSNAAVKFVVLGFFILLENPLLGKPSFIWETIWFGFLSLLSGFTSSQCANCLNLVFPLALGGMRIAVHTVRLVTVSEASLPLFPTPGLTLFSANLVLLESPVTLLCGVSVLTGVRAHFLTQNIVVVAEIAVRRRYRRHILCFSEIICHWFSCF